MRFDEADVMEIDLVFGVGAYFRVPLQGNGLVPHHILLFAALCIFNGSSFLLGDIGLVGRGSGEDDDESQRRSWC